MPGSILQVAAHGLDHVNVLPAPGETQAGWAAKLVIGNRGAIA